MERCDIGMSNTNVVVAVVMNLACSLGGAYLIWVGSGSIEIAVGALLLAAFAKDG